MAGGVLDLSVADYIRVDTWNYLCYLYHHQVIQSIISLGNTDTLTSVTNTIKTLASQKVVTKDEPKQGGARINIQEGQKSQNLYLVKLKKSKFMFSWVKIIEFIEFIINY